MLLSVFQKLVLICWGSGVQKPPQQHGPPTWENVLGGDLLSDTATPLVESGSQSAFLHETSDSRNFQTDPGVLE